MKKWKCHKDAKKRMKASAKPLTWKAVEKKLRSGNLTKEQAIALCQQYMDSLEYKEAPQMLTDCGGIQPLPILPEFDVCCGGIQPIVIPEEKEEE